MFDVQKKNTRPMLQESSTDVAIIISFYYTVDVACNMMLILRWEFSIREWYIRVICIYLYFYVVSVNFQCCNYYLSKL